MKVLVLGGTRLVGRHLVEAALERGHTVSMFNRGQHDTGENPQVERLIGDRTGDLSALEGRRWDAVFDVSGYLPCDVRASSELLAGRTGHFTFVSTVSVYRDFLRLGMAEDAPVEEPDFETPELQMERYGAQKSACEQVAREVFGADRLLVARLGMMVGPHDYMDRFPYWVRRIARGGEVLAPGDPNRPVQLIDARDLGAWLVRMAEEGRAGTFNATGPAQRLTMRGMLEGIRDSVGGDAAFTWVPTEFLLEREVKEWSELPFWIRDTMRGVLTVDVRRAVAAGLTFRPLAETARDVLAWEPSRSDEDRKCGLTPEREAELLREWKALGSA